MTCKVNCKQVPHVTSLMTYDQYCTYISNSIYVIINQLVLQVILKNSDH